MFSEEHYLDHVQCTCNQNEQNAVIEEENCNETPVSKNNLGM